MAWVELELDEQTWRNLSDRAEREGVTVAEVVRRIATRAARRPEANGDHRRYVAVGSLGDRSETSQTLHQADRSLSEA